MTITTETERALRHIKLRYGGLKPDVVINAANDYPQLREQFNGLDYAEQRSLATRLIEEFTDREFALAPTASDQATDPEETADEQETEETEAPTEEELTDEPEPECDEVAAYDTQDDED